MKRWCFFFLLVGGSLFLPFFAQRLTLGFHPAKLRFSFPYHLEKKQPPVTEEIEGILKQPFTYLNRGSQLYVFESQDKKYVLKLFRYNRSQFPAIQKIKKWFHKKEKTNLCSKIEKTFNAYAIAFFEAPECTQLLYVHLQPDREKFPQVTLTDPIGRTWLLRINEYRFALQRKADSFKETLVRNIENIAEMRTLLQSFLSLMVNRTHLQIRNSDHNLWPNFGFFENRAVEIDCGNYRKCPALSDPELRIQEIERFFYPLFQWMIKHAPEYLHVFHLSFLVECEKIRNPSSKGEGP